ncbi:hypothetical protein ACFVJ8_29135 [Streptomyces yangpuensis]|uniref:hypothetical protein n=1 Tax=Streptomyces yangpuensis TaxID=1648182 RepID=UPI003645CA0E
MLILRSKVPHRDPLPATASMAAALPLGVALPAVSVMSGDRFGTAVTLVLIVVSLALIACTGALAARSAARAERARRDEAVLDALEPLAGLRR